MRKATNPLFRLSVFAGASISSGCGRAPIFNAWGSYFPAWLVCTTVAVLFTFAIHWLLRRLHVELVLSVVTYPSLTALITFALWLALFR